MYTVSIRGLEFYAYHGVPAEEKVVGHRYRIDADFEVGGHADQSDDIADTLDYGQVSQEIVAIAQGCKCHTIERLARIIADEVILGYASVYSIKLTVAKRLPPAPIIAEEASVTLTVHRGGIDA